VDSIEEYPPSEDERWASRCNQVCLHHQWDGLLLFCFCAEIHGEKREDTEWAWQLCSGSRVVWWLWVITQKMQESFQQGNSGLHFYHVNPKNLPFLPWNRPFQPFKE
jgi:hypothetical protein